MNAQRRLALVLVAILLLPSFTLHALAADDSNAGSLTQASIVNPQALSSALNSLSQNATNPQLQQMLNQFNSQLKNGDYAGAASTLVQLKTYSNSAGGQGVPDALNALLQSLSVGQNGASINSGVLSNLLGADSPTSNGMPSHMTGQTPVSASVDLQTLATLLQYTDPTLTKELLSESSQLTQGSGSTGGSGISITPQGLQSGLVGTLPIRPPSIGVGAVASLPTFDPITFLIPVLAIGVVSALFLSRRRLGMLLGSQVFQRRQSLEDEGQDVEFDPNSPKKRAFFYFGRMIRLMRERGTPKFIYETHREFSSRCDGMSEGDPVRQISGLYEKARFSDRDVTPQDAEQAAHQLSRLERIRN